MQGTLSPSYGVADVVKGIYGGRRSGILKVEADGASKRLYFEKGSLVYSDTNDPEWRLGRLLVHRGKIDDEALNRVLTLKAPNKRIGSVLLNLGYLDEQELAAAVEFQITENVFPMFSWRAGEFGFEEREQPAPSDIAFAIPTASIIMEGIRRIDSPEFIGEALGPGDQVVLLGADPLLRFQAIHLRPKEGFILSRIDGLLTVDEICTICPVPEDEVLRCLYGLKSAGVLEIRPPAEVGDAEGGGDVASFFADFAGAEEFLGQSRVASKEADLASEERAEIEEIQRLASGLDEADHYGVLGVESTAAEAAIRKAYYRLAKRFHPDRHHRSHLAEYQEKLERIFVRINEAYETLRDPSRRGSYDRGLAIGAPVSKDEAIKREAAPVADPARDAEMRREASERHFADGKRRLSSGDVFGAINSFRFAVRNEPGSPAYRSYLGRALGRNPKWRKEAEENLLKAAELDPMNGDHFAQLGVLYEGAGLQAKADRYFAEALKRDPTNKAALARRKPSQDARPQPGAKGGAGLSETFRSLFGDKRK